jgi:hypothetical protein
MCDDPADADAGAPRDLLTEIEIDLKRQLSEAREYAIRETFGGPNMYRLLAERNPQIRLILNAGIMAGIRQADWIKLDAAWQEDAWRLLREMAEPGE